LRAPPGAGGAEVTARQVPLIAGHRGAPRLARENTIPALEAAVACGAGMLEFDVRRTGDHHLVLSHDATLDGKAIGGLELAGLRVGGSRLDSLDDALHAIRGRVAIDVELKESGYEADVVDLVHERFGMDRVTFSSFDPASVEALARQPRVRQVGLNVEIDSLLRHELPQDAGDLVELALDIGATVLAPNVELLSTTLRADALSAGLPLYVWTVNDPDMIRYCLREPAIMVIITDVPEVAVPLRQEWLDETRTRET
jgi:glycerophosphoryl diester phosphodiesterase